MIKFNINNFRKNRGLAFKLILFIFSSIAIIFFIAFLYTYIISGKIVKKNLRQNAKSLTIGAVIKVDKALSIVQKIAENYSKIIEDGDYTRQEYIKITRVILQDL